MAMHKKWRQTYISTPSSLSHPAYAFWSGANFNRGKAKADKVARLTLAIPIWPEESCAPMASGVIVTVEDAARGGCDLFGSSSSCVGDAG